MNPIELPETPHETKKESYGIDYAQLFKKFTEADDLEETLQSFEDLKNACIDIDSVGITSNRELFEKMRDATLNSINPTGVEFWKTLGSKYELGEYNEGPCTGINALVIGCGPAGLRTAIEVCLLGGSAHVLEKRSTFTRNNSLHLWPSTIQDLKSLGCKYFWSKLCSGLIHHVAVKRLHLVLLKSALLVGVKVHPGTEFKAIKPLSVQSSPSEVHHPKWRAIISRTGNEQEDEELGFEFDVLVGADGEKSQVAEMAQFERKTFQGGTAIGITANFVNTNTREETALDEFGLMSVYNRPFFDELSEKYGCTLENLVMYHDETHYFVMTPKKECLLAKGVLQNNTSDTPELLSKNNVSREALKQFVREVADYCKLPSFCEFAKSYSHGENDEDDVELFDFSKKQMSIVQSKLLSFSDLKQSLGDGGTAINQESKLLVILVGDALVEPFWPQGTGANRGLLSALDAAWIIKSLADGLRGKASEREPLEIEKGAYKILQTAQPDDVKLGDFGLDPNSRYKGFVSSLTTMTTAPNEIPTR